METLVIGQYLQPENCPGTHESYVKGCRCFSCAKAYRTFLSKPKDHDQRLQKQRAARAKLRKKLNKIKLESGCVDCGYAKHPAALQFDHVRGKKEFNVGNSISLAWSRVLDEIEKCEVVCANCHSVRTFERNST